MEDSKNVFRVYFPIECLRQNSSPAIGCIDQEKRLCCVTGLFRRASCLPSVRRSDDVRVVAIWANSADRNFVPNDHGGSEEVQSYDCSTYDILLYIEKRKDYLSVRWHPSCETIDCSIEFVLILYESASFLASTTLNEMMTDKDPSVKYDSTNAGIILASLVKQRHFVSSLGYKEQSEFYDPAQPRRKTIPHFVTDVALMLPNYVITCIIVKMSLWLSNLRFFRIPFVKAVLQLPASLTQIERRFVSDLAEAETLCNSDQPLPPGVVRFENRKCCLLLDVFLGICLMNWLWSNNVVGIYADRFLNWAEVVAVEFDSLLHWLMGAPAGLKLNEPFAYFLGNFFQYHVFLWKAYLRTLRPFWSDICCYGCLSGCLGLTVQLSLLQDLISMMTIHIYCFYVYAASLQVLALSSLWRLFCGKKWNVLRKRVDSASYDIDQLFAGTLLFTILLFTLPTTALFYVVFTLLRLMVLSLQGILITLVSLMNRVPVYWLFLRLVYPEAVAGHIHISIVQQSPMCVRLQLRPLSALELFKMSGKTASDTTSNNSWSCLGKKLLLGHLIYPWIERSSSN